MLDSKYAGKTVFFFFLVFIGFIISGSILPQERKWYVFAPIYRNTDLNSESLDFVGVYCFVAIILFNSFI